MDAVDILDNGEGLTLIGGDTAPVGAFQDFIDRDEGEKTTGRYGVVTTKEGTLYVIGWLNFGDASNRVDFEDSFKAIIFIAGKTGQGFSGLGIDFSQASGYVNFDNCTFTGRGIGSQKKFFDTALEVDLGTDDITIADHGFSTGDYVLYSAEGGSAITGLTDATNYFVRAIDSNTLSLYAVGATVGRQNSVSDTSRLTLTADSAPGANHSLKRFPDNRSEVSVTNTTGVGLTSTNCTYNTFRLLTLNSVSIIIGGFIINSGTIIPSTSTLTGITFSGMTTEEGEAFITPATPAQLENITDCVFISNGISHAIELTSADATERTSDNTYTGYWNPTEFGWNFHTQTGVEPTGDIITTDAAHGFADGEAVYYNNEGGTDDIGTGTDPVNASKYYIGLLSPTTFTIHLTKAAALAASSIIPLQDGSGGETHSFYSANATVFNDSGGAITINVTTGTSSPSARNGTSASTTVNASVPIVILIQDGDKLPILDAQTSIHLLDSPYTEIANQDSATDGFVSIGYSGTTPIDVVIKARKSDAGDDPRYVPYSSVQTISESGLSLTITMKPSTILN